MENTHLRIAALLLFIVLIFEQIPYTTCEDLSNKKPVDLISEHITKTSTSDGIDLQAREKRQLGFYPYGGYYRRVPIPIIIGGGIGFGGRGFGFGRPGFGFGRGFGGFGGRGFGGFGGRGFGGFGGRGFGGFGGRGFGGFGGRGFGGFGGRGFGGFGGRGFGGGRGGRG